MENKKKAEWIVSEGKSYGFGIWGLVNDDRIIALTFPVILQKVCDQLWFSGLSLS